MSKNYDVALSFAGEDRPYVRAVADALVRLGVTIFYDEFAEADLIGRNLVDHLSDIYQNQAKLCVLFLSAAYAKKPYARLERQSAQARAFLSDEAYIIPVRLDDSEVPGILRTVGYASGKTPEALALLIASKLFLNEPAGIRAPGIRATGGAVIARFSSLIEPDIETFSRTLQAFDHWSPTKLGSIPVELRIPQPFFDQIEASKKFRETEAWRSEAIREEARQQFSQCYDQNIPKFHEDTIKGTTKLISIYYELGLKRLEAVVRRFLMSRNTLLARLILDMRLVGMDPVEWEHLFVRASQAWSTNIMDGLVYVAFLEGDERFLWVDVDGKDDTGLRPERIKLFAPAKFLVDNECRRTELTSDPFDRFFALQLLDRQLKGAQSYSLSYFAEYPGRLDLTTRGEWAYETIHFSNHGTSNFGGKPLFKAVRHLYESLLQEVSPEDDPNEPPDHKRMRVVFKIKRLFRNDGDQFDHLWS